jgi:chemotaxis protein MotA
MDIATGLGLLAGAIVLATLILMGGDLRMFLDVHAAIVIFGGSFAATLIRFRCLRSSTACRLVPNLPFRFAE